MSDEKPFAVKRYDATANVPGCSCCGPSVDFREDADGDWVKVEDHNAAVAARERKAAVRALRALAKRVGMAHGTINGKSVNLAEWLKSEAAALEGGA